MQVNASQILLHLLNQLHNLSSRAHHVLYLLLVRGQVVEELLAPLVVEVVVRLLGAHTRPLPDLLPHAHLLPVLKQVIYKTKVVIEVDNMNK